jgi:hypothetical protein
MSVRAAPNPNEYPTVSCTSSERTQCLGTTFKKGFDFAFRLPLSSGKVLQIPIVKETTRAIGCAKEVIANIFIPKLRRSHLLNCFAVLPPLRCSLPRVLTTASANPKYLDGRYKQFCLSYSVIFDEFFFVPKEFRLSDMRLA